MFPLIGKARPRSWCRPPYVLWLCHKCRNWKGVRRSMVEPLPQRNTKNFKLRSPLQGNIEALLKVWLNNYVETLDKTGCSTIGITKQNWLAPTSIRISRISIERMLISSLFFYVPTTHKRTGVVLNGE